MQWSEHSESPDRTQHRVLVKRFAESCQEAVQASGNVLLAAQTTCLFPLLGFTHAHDASEGIKNGP